MEGPRDAPDCTYRYGCGSTADAIGSIGACRPDRRRDQYRLSVVLPRTAVPSPPYTNPPPTEIEGGELNVLSPPIFPLAWKTRRRSMSATRRSPSPTRRRCHFAAFQRRPAPTCSPASRLAFPQASTSPASALTRPAPRIFDQPASVLSSSLTPTDIIVNLVGENPALGSQLILDVTTAVTPPPSVPEPATVTLLSVGLGAILIGRRKKAAGAPERNFFVITAK